METELTKKIKIACRYYKPAMNSNLRTIRYANEVWTPTGIVDCIRFEDYVQQDKSSCKLIDFDKFASSEKTFLTNVIYDGIKDLVPEGVGIIVYNKKTEKLRMKKECNMKFIDDELRVYLLYNALKKWCDGNQN